MQLLVLMFNILKGLWKLYTPGPSFTLFVCRSDVDSNATQIEPRVVECNAKIAVALSVMYEGFRPCIDDGSEINLIHSVMYNCG